MAGFGESCSGSVMADTVPATTGCSVRRSELGSTFEKGHSRRRHRITKPGATVIVVGLKRSPGSPGQHQDGFQSSRWPVVNPYVATRRTRDVARDAQPQAGASCLPAARGLEPEERVEHALEHGLGNSGSFVTDAKRHGLRTVLDADMGPLSVNHRVVQQVADAAFQ